MVNPNVTARMKRKFISCMKLFKVNQTMNKCKWGKLYKPRFKTNTDCLIC